MRDGYHPVIIGQRAHVEVRGLTEDLDDFDVVLDEDDVQELDGYPRLGVAAQTTQPIERVRHLVALIRRRFPRSDVRFIDTVCQPTKQRQKAAVELARQCDVVIVIGGANSNNTRELVSTCRRHCSHVHHVQTESDLRSEWFAAAGTVGITAGTSTPDHVIDRIDRRIRQLAVERGEGASGSSRAADDARTAASVRAGSWSWCLPSAWRGSRPPACTTCACWSIGSSPIRPNPLPIHGVLGQVELVREAATLVMLVTLGMLAGRTRRARLGYTAVAFGVWDIFYYVFLR